jgi:hypothetical protein
MPAIESRFALRTALSRSLGYPATDSEQGGAGRGCSLLAIEVSPVFGDVRIHLGPMSVAEREHAPNQGRVECRKLLVHLVRGKTSLVEFDHRVEADPVAREDDLSVGPLRREVRKILGPSVSGLADLHASGVVFRPPWPQAHCCEHESPCERHPTRPQGAWLQPAARHVQGPPAFVGPVPSFATS